MNRKLVWVTGFAVIFAVSLIAGSNAFTDASGALESDKSTVPRYSETCAHGHNGFDCKTSKHIMDISELQEKTAELEKRIFQLEISR